MASVGQTKACLDGLSGQIKQVLERAGIEAQNKTHPTKAGWCLKQGLEHVAATQHQSLLPLVTLHGVPTFYLKKKQQSHCRHDATQDLKDPQTCFESLCRIVAGQFVSGKSAQAAWKRLLDLATVKQGNGQPKGGESGQQLNPSTILAYQDKVNELQTMAGVTLAKARSILDLAQRFGDGRLTEEWLSHSSTSEDEIRQALMQVKGIGQWSCDMFLLFYLEKPNVLPLGDLGVRKRIAQHFGMKNTRKQPLCPKKDAAKIRQQLQDYAPFWSLLSYYMWRVADTPASAGHATKQSNNAILETSNNQESRKSTSVKRSSSPTPTTPRKSRRLATRSVTP